MTPQFISSPCGKYMICGDEETQTAYELTPENDTLSVEKVGIVYLFLPFYYNSHLKTILWYPIYIILGNFITKCRTFEFDPCSPFRSGLWRPDRDKREHPRVPRFETGFLAGLFKEVLTFDPTSIILCIQKSSNNIGKISRSYQEILSFYEPKWSPMHIVWHFSVYKTTHDIIGCDLSEIHFCRSEPLSVRKRRPKKPPKLGL